MPKSVAAQFGWFSVLCWLCWLSLGVRAQYRFDHWTTENGLPQNSVYSLQQTRDGYLWLTTLDGLVRYDGAGFRVFNKANSPGINSNRFTRLVEDREGALWACTEDGGLTRFFNGVFTTYTTEQGLPHNWVFNLRQAGAREMLIQTRTGLVRWRDGDISLVSTDLKSFDIVLGYPGASGAVWYRLGTKLRRVKDGATTEYDVPAFSPDDQHYPQLYEDRQGRLWIGAKQPGLLLCWQDGRLTEYTPRDGLPPAVIGAFCEDRNGTLWFGTEGGGLVQYRAGRFNTFTKEQGLPSNHLVTVYEDHEGTLWAGTVDSGLVRISPQIIKAYAAEAGLPRKSYYPLLEDRAGNLWVGGEGLYRFKNGNFTYYPLDISPDARQSRARFKQVSALYEDRAGRLWIGSDVDLFSFKDEQFRVETERLGAQFAQSVVYAILQDSNGCLWFGTSDGLVEYRAGARRRYTTADGLPGNEIHALYEDRQGALWVGTYGGLARLAQGQINAYTERAGLSSRRIRALYEDGEGTLWIGTYDGGLNRFKEGHFTRYDMSHGLFSNGVFQILEDGAGNFWMSSNQGIYCVSRQHLNDFAAGRRAAIRSVSYGKADGMLNAECNGGQQPAGIRARDGRLWFPTIAGIVVVDPQAVSFNPQPPPVVIERVLLERQEVDFRAPLRLYPGQQNLEIDYAGLSFIKPEHVRFRYQLGGLDDGWVEAGQRRTAFYPHLPVGEYFFKVSAANADDVWNTAGASLRIVVLPPFYRTWWFRALAALAVLGLSALAYQARVRQLKRARATQEEFSRRLIESQEHERQRIAAELHDSLSQSLVIIKNRAALSLSTPDDTARAFEQLEEIADSATQAISEVKEISYALRPYQLDRLGLQKALASMVKKVAEANGLMITAEIEPLDGVFAPEGEINLYRIVQESVNNIVRHAQATVAQVTIKRRLQSLEVQIQDNGKGFLAGVSQQQEPGQGGFGLLGLAERARILGAQLMIQSAPGAGTTVKLEIPLPPHKL